MLVSDWSKTSPPLIDKWKTIIENQDLCSLDDRYIYPMVVIDISQMFI